MTEGFSWLHTDENGFNNQNVPEKTDVLVMGSSHMEAFNVAKDENAVALLNRKMPELSFYNIGISGHDLYRCVDNVVDALDVYQPAEYVIIETSMVDLDEDSMKAVIDGSAQSIPSYDTGLMYHMQKISAVKWLFKQFQDWVKIGSTDEAAQSESLLTTEKDIVGNEGLLRDFLRKVGQAADDHGCKAIVVYHPTLDLDFFQNGYLNSDTVSVNRFKHACEENGIIFVDLTDDFVELYDQEHLQAHGFMNTTVGQGHLNRYGHKVMAERLGIVLKDDMQKEGVHHGVE